VQFFDPITLSRNAVDEGKVINLKKQVLARIIIKVSAQNGVGLLDSYVP
jgi:hypothetical protein